MILQIVATRDIKANAYAQPQFVHNLGHYLRAFGDEVNRQEESNLLWKHPEDFELYHLGEYDDANGTFNIFKTPLQLAVASNYKRTIQ